MCALELHIVTRCRRILVCHEHAEVLSCPHKLSMRHTQSHLHAVTPHTFEICFKKGCTFATISTHRTPSFTFSLSLPNTNTHSFGGYIVLTHHGKPPCHFCCCCLTEIEFHHKHLFNAGCVILLIVLYSMKCIAMCSREMEIKHLRANASHFKHIAVMAFTTTSWV